MNLKTAKPNETLSDSAHDCPLFQFFVAVVEHVAHHTFTRGAQRKRPGGRHAEMVHCFAAEEFSD